MALRVGIVGSRTFLDLSLVEKVVRRLLARDGGLVIVTGGARGADALAEAVAKKLCRRPPEIFHPEWSRYGSPKAAFMRNQQIVDVSDEIVAFWDGASRGTMDTIRRALDAEKPIFVYQSEAKQWLSHDEILSAAGR